MLSSCFIFAFLWLQGMSNIYFICLWVICIFPPGNFLHGFSSPPNTKLLNRKQHRKPASQLCCHRASARGFEVWAWNRLLLFPLIFLVFDYFLSSHLPPQPMCLSSLGHAPSISLHQAAVVNEPEILERQREGQMRSKLVLRGTALLWKNPRSACLMKIPPYHLIRPHDHDQKVVGTSSLLLGSGMKSLLLSGFKAGIYHPWW